MNLWSRWQCPVLLLAFTASWAVVGCGRHSGPERFDVSGSVTFQGKPVPAGRIVFEPDRTRGNNGPQGFAKITNGRYNTAKSGKGTVGGLHVVKISGHDGVSTGEMSPQGTPLFPTFTTSVDLPKKSKALDFDVPAVGEKKWQ